MEILIVFVALGILGFVFYESLPNPKFKKAIRLFNDGKFAEASEILVSIFEKHPDAPARLAECKLKQGQHSKLLNEVEALKYFNEAIEIKMRLSAKASKSNYELIEALAYYEIAQLKFKNSLISNSDENKIKELKDSLKFIDQATKTGINIEFNILSKSHFSELAGIYFEYGFKSEKNKKYETAIDQYSRTIEFASKSAESNVFYDSITRKGISKLKNNEHVELGILDEVVHAKDEYKKDFLFRLSKTLLKNNEYLDAEKIIIKHLNFSSPDVEKLKELIKAKKINDAAKKVDDINYQVDQLYEKSFPITEVKSLYEKLDLRIDEIKLVIPAITEKLVQLKPGLFNRLLAYYFDNEQYEKSISLIQEYPLFYESPELLKNLGISCYRLTAQGGLTERNYKQIISCWLTALFCDKVILKSMEETSWDDEYTFTLIDAIGSRYKQYSNLPPNVNYSSISDSNISIGATQNELLQQFELLLHQQISKESLLKTVIDFYENERDAIKKIVTIINKDILFASPYFANQFGINVPVIKELEADYKEYSNEEVLEAGLAYLIENSSSHIYKYASAKEVLTKVQKAIENENMRDLEAVITNSNKSLIEEYDSINSVFEDLVYNSFALKIEEDDENEDLIPMMEECIRFTDNKAKLKFQYSSYIADLCISKVNSDVMSNFKALSLMKKAYINSPGNVRICKNVSTLIRYNLTDFLNDKCTNEKEMLAIIDFIGKNRSKTFIANSDELKRELKTIDDALKKNGSSNEIILKKHFMDLSQKGVKIVTMIKTLNQLI